MTDWERDYARWVDGRGAALRATAYLLCGNWHAAEDLTQTALTKLYLAWRRLDRAGSVDAYARKVLMRTFLDERRRPWRREHTAADPPDVP
ncbi:MAG TPA: sigma factor, partial [Mycobacteriales bacterium]|nr:sigma factor [Mycobacteriales bacterium]